MFTHAAPGTFLRALAVTAAAALVLPLVGAGVPAQADTAVAPKSGSVTVQGAGWGHGKGMSQWGAYGAATKGLDYTEIIAFYYPGTTLDSLPDGNTIRVWISADNDNGVHVRVAKGLTLTDSAGTKLTLPTGTKYTKWRVRRSGSSRVLSYRNASGTYVTYATKLDPARVWYFSNPTTDTVRLVNASAGSDGQASTSPFDFAGDSEEISVAVWQADTPMGDDSPS